jgi:hypothetical protein
MTQKINVVLALSFAGLIFFATLKTGSPIYHDDAFISLTYAKNLLWGNGLVFNPGEHVWGFTSPFHVILLSVVGLLFADLPSADLSIGVISCVSYPLVLFYLLRRFTSEGIAFSMSVLTLSSPYNFQFLGLETNLLILAQMGLLYLSIFGNPTTVGFLSALTCLIRPDSVIFAVPILLFNKRLRTLKVALAFIIPGLLWESFALIYYSDWLPQTFHAKKGLTDLQRYLMIALPGVSKITYISQENAPYLWAGLNLVTTLGCLLNKGIRASLPIVYALLIYPWILVFAYALIGAPPEHSWEYRSALVFNAIGFALGLLEIIQLSSDKLISIVGRDKHAVAPFFRYAFVIGLLFFVANNTQDHLKRIQGEQTSYWWGGRHHTYLMVATWLRDNVPYNAKVLYGEPPSSTVRGVST